MIRIPRSGRAAALALVAVAIAGSGVAAAKIVKRPLSATTDNPAIVRQSFDAWTAHTGSPFDLLAPDAVWTIAGRSVVAKRYTSRNAFLTEVIRPFNARMKEPLKPVIRGLYADGDMVIVLFDASGVALDGRPYRNSYSWFLRMRAGRIVEGTAFFDSIEFDDLWNRVTPREAQ
jgi:uncharacterized protein